MYFMKMGSLRKECCPNSKTFSLFAYFRAIKLVVGGGPVGGGLVGWWGGGLGRAAAQVED